MKKGKALVCAFLLWLVPTALFCVAMQIQIGQIILLEFMAPFFVGAWLSYKSILFYEWLTTEYKGVYKTLTGDEYDVLNKIADKTKMDCWFCIKQKKDGADYVYDLELGNEMCLKEGISQLLEGIDCVENYERCCLSAEEERILQSLLGKLGIEFCRPEAII